MRSLVQRTKDVFSGKPLIQGNELEEFWALKDINFQVGEGERLGIIGRNGAGKSTLLKILSRITEPTCGRIRIKGRVASLLEVGTGFNPELTGRENIFLNGAILGMRYAEIQRKFDEIVAFAEVEKFLDTPVKRYSSGMYVRLAFAVAAHLDPEILIVDEVLAVGDIEFQKKCLGKMGEVAKQGRTVLFVSHNMGAVRDLCTRVLLLREGSLIKNCDADEGINTYLESVCQKTELSAKDFSGPLAKLIKISSFEINGHKGQVVIRPSQEIQFSMTGQCLERIAKVRFSVSVIQEGFRIFTVNDSREPFALEVGSFIVNISIPAYVLRPGCYTISIGAHDGGVHTGDKEWMYAPDVFRVEIAPEWNEKNDFGDVGVINIDCKGSRICC
jgi:lipopolysaccharide transport system ATP-binding protein